MLALMCLTRTLAHQKGAPSGAPLLRLQICKHNKGETYINFCKGVIEVSFSTMLELLQEKVMTNIVIYLTCQEMHMNGPQNTLPNLSIATSALVFLVEGCGIVGGFDSSCTSNRLFYGTTYSHIIYSLRPLLYVK